MLTIWKANFSGTEGELEKVKAKFTELAKKYNTKVDGPYYAQDADLLWLFWSDSLLPSGKDFMPWVAENQIPIEPVSWEVAVTEKEFWG